MPGKPPDYTAYDEVVVQRLMADRFPGEAISAADAAEATRRLARRSYSDGQIAYRLGMHRRSVIRIRARHGIPAGLPVGSNRHDRPHDVPTRSRKRG